MKAGRVRFAWDSTLPTWLGVMRRGGDGKDLRWFKGPERCATHTMGMFSATATASTSTWTWARRTSFRSSPTRTARLSTWSPRKVASRDCRSISRRHPTRLRDGSAVSAHRRVVTPGRPLPHRAVHGAVHALPRRHAAFRSTPGRADGSGRSTPGHASSTRRDDAIVFRRGRCVCCRNAASCRARSARPKAMAICRRRRSAVSKAAATC